MRFQEQPKNVGNFVTCKACMWVFEKVEGYILTDENEDKLLDWAAKVNQPHFHILIPSARQAFKRGFSDLLVENG